MKKLLPLIAMLPGFSYACADISSYSVDGLVFDKLTVHQAISETLKGTPYQVVHVAPEPPGLVNATGVKGGLDSVLPNLLGRFDLDYVQNGCEIRILQKSQRWLRLEAGDLLNVRLEDWLKNHGYTLFWEAPKYRVSGALTIVKPVDETLEEIMSLMRSNGVKLVTNIYDNRAVRVTEIQ